MEPTMQPKGGCLALIALFGLAYLVVGIVTGGMWRTQLEYTIPEPSLDTTIAAPSVMAGRETPFEDVMTARHWLFGMVQGKQPNLDDVVRKYVRRGDRVKRISITTRHTIVDNLLLTITLGIYTPVTTTVAGVIVSGDNAAK